MSNQKTATGAQNSLGPKECLLLHLNEIITNSHLKRVAYAHKTGGKENRFYEEPDYIQTNGLSRLVYGKEDRAKVGPRLANLVEKGYVIKWDARPITAKKPSACYQITKDGMDEIAPLWKRISEQVWNIDIGDDIRDFTFMDLLEDLYKREKSPLVVRLLKILENRDIKDVVVLDELLTTLGFDKEKDEKWNSAIIGLQSFKKNQRNIFFGMDDEIRTLKQRIREKNWVFVLGPSGSGKSSLVNAGLARHPIEETEVIVTDAVAWESFKSQMLDLPRVSNELRLFAENMDSKPFLDQFAKTSTPQSWVLVFDQFEELFVPSQSTKKDKLRTFIQECLGKVSNVKFVFVVKDSGWKDCAKWREAIEKSLVDEKRDVVPYGEYAHEINQDTYATILRKITSYNKLGVSSTTQKQIIKELTGLQGTKQKFCLTYLQIVLENLRDEETYEPNCIRRWIREHLDELLRKSGGEDDPLRRSILLHLSGEEGKNRMTEEELWRLVGPKVKGAELEYLRKALHDLKRFGILDYPQKRWGFVHDFLAEEINHIFNEDEKEQRRVQRMFDTNFKYWKEKERQSASLLRADNLDDLQNLDVWSFSEDEWGFIWLSVAHGKFIDPFPFDSKNIASKSIAALLSLLGDPNTSTEEKKTLAEALGNFVDNIERERQHHICRWIIDNAKGQDPQVQQPLFGVINEIEFSEEMRREFLDLLKDISLKEFVKAELIYLIGDSFLRKIVENLEQESLPIRVKEEVIWAVRDNPELADCVPHLLPFLRPSTWHFREMFPTFNSKDSSLLKTLDSYETTLTKETFEAILSVISPEHAPLIVPYLNDPEVHLPHLLFLLGKIRNEMAIPDLVSVIKKDHAREKKRQGLESLLLHENDFLRHFLEEIGVAALLKKWGSLSTDEIDNEIQALYQKAKDSFQEKGEKYFGRAPSSGIYDMWNTIESFLIHTLLSFSNKEIVQTGLDALAEIGGTRGTKAFLEVIKYLQQNTHYMGRFSRNDPHAWCERSPWDNTLGLVEGHLNLELCLPLFRYPDIRYYYKTLLSLPQLSKSDSDSLHFLGATIRKGKENQETVKSLKYIFCKLATGNQRKEQLAFALELEPMKNEFLYHDTIKEFFSDLPWQQFEEYIYPLLDGSSDEQKTLILSIIKVIDPKTIDPQELVQHLDPKRPHDERVLFLELLLKHEDNEMFKDLLKIYRNEDEYKGTFLDLFHAVYSSKTLPERPDIVQKFTSVVSLDGFLPMIEDHLRKETDEREPVLFALAGLWTLASNGVVSSEYVSSLLTEEQVWANLAEWVFWLEKDYLVSLFTTYLSREDVWKLSKNLDEKQFIYANDEAMYNFDFYNLHTKTYITLDILAPFAQQDDFDFFLPFINSQFHDVRGRVEELLIKLDHKRAFPLLFLRSLLGAEIQRGREQLKTGVSLIGLSNRTAPVRKLIDFAVGGIKEKMDQHFRGWVSENDFVTVFNSDRLENMRFCTRAQFHPMGLSSGPKEMLKVIGENREKEFVPLLKELYVQSSFWFNQDRGSFPLFATDFILALRKLEDTEDLCHLVFADLQGTSRFFNDSQEPMSFGRTALYLFLDHGMDELYSLGMVGRGREAVKRLLTVFKEQPSYRQKVLGFLAKFHKGTILKELQSKNFVFIAQSVAKGLQDNGLNLFEEDEEPDTLDSLFTFDPPKSF